MKKHYLLFALCSLFFAGTAHAVSFPSQPNMPLSQYGMIQNVQNYSTNPFWDSNSPYNQRFPTAVYAQGADLTAADCQAVVTSLVSMQCGMNNNCNGVRLNDIKPTIMVQLSQMTGANYVSSCGGFIDDIFNKYVEQYGNAVQGAAFPTAVNPGNNLPGNEFKIENPYEIKKKAYGSDTWHQDMADREDELERLQSQNGAGTVLLAKTDMPATYGDLSFTERMANAAAGYEQWAPVYSTICDSDGKNCRRACVKNCTYQTIGIESDEKRIEREAAEARHRENIQMHQAQITMSDDEFCKRYPRHDRCKKQNNSDNTTIAHEDMPELIDVSNDPKYQDIYGLLITESPWWSWGAAAIGGAVGAVVCIATGGVPCLVGAGATTTWTAAGVTAGLVGAGTGLGAIVSNTYRMADSEAVGKLPAWQSDWRGCFNLCGKDSDANDLLTIKVLRPVLGGTDRYCIQKDLYYTLHNITKDEPVFFTKEQTEKIKTGLGSIADTGHCDWHFNDADAYIVKYNIDTIFKNKQTGREEYNYIITVASDAIRIDD